MLMEEIGVDYFVDYIASQDNLIPEVQELTGGGPHAAIVVASVEWPISQAIQVSSMRLTYCLALKLIF